MAREIRILRRLKDGRYVAEYPEYRDKLGNVYGEFFLSEEEVKKIGSQSTLKRPVE